ncbi:MAG: type II secretion system protein [Candidatus Riflebacteria bacterium]
MKNRKKGMSLIELMIGFLIIGGVTLIYFQTMNSSRKKSQFYAEHFMAALLAGKVVENCLQETDINPYGVEALGLADEKGKAFKVSTLITDGRSVFFKSPTISQEETPDLYEQVKKDFLLKIDTDGSKNKFFSVNTSFDWNASTGSGNFAYDCFFPNYVMKQEATSSYAFPEDQLEKRVVERILAEKGALSSIVTSPSAAEVAMATGRIYFSVAGLISSPDFKAACEQAEKIKNESCSSSSDRYAEGTEKYFAIARDSLDLLLYLKPHIDYVCKNIKTIDSMKLYHKSQLENYLYKSGVVLEKLQQLFFTCVNEAASRYREQIKTSLNLRNQRFLIERCLSMQRLLFANRKFCKDVFVSANAENTIKSEYYDFLDVVASYFESRDPAVFRLALQEKKFARDEVLKQRYFTCNYVGLMFASIEELLKKLPQPITGSNVYKAAVVGQPLGDGTIEGAVTWARDQLKGGQRKGLNVNNGMTSIDETAWNDWCLAFVNTAYGRKIANLQAGSAVESMYKFKADGKLRINKKPPAGAIMFTDKTPTNQYGHIFIATGKFDADGDPIVITTGSTGYNGVREISLTEMLKVIGGNNYYRGWATIE